MEGNEELTMIRDARPEDVKEIQSLMEQLEGRAFDAELFKERYLDLLTREEDYVYVYELDGKAVGMVNLLVKRPLHHTYMTAEVVEITVDEAYRNRKIGGALLEHAEKWCIANGLEQIELCTKFTRKDAQRFYEHHEYDLERYNYSKELMEGEDQSAW